MVLRFQPFTASMSLTIAPVPFGQTLRAASQIVVST